MNVVISQLPMHWLSCRSGRYRVPLLHFIHLADGLTWSDIKYVESHRETVACPWSYLLSTDDVLVKIKLQ